MERNAARLSIVLSVGLVFVLAIMVLLPKRDAKPAAPVEAESPAVERPVRAVALRLPAPPPAPIRNRKSTMPAASRAELPAPRSTPAGPVEAAVASADEGRMRLRLLEHGEGPAIEIAWPADPGERRRLHNLFLRCFGMESAVLGGRGELYADDGPAGQPWPINLDRLSGFIRQADGRLSEAEETEARRIRARHGLTSGAPLVRLFPRRVDARLLGGLSRIAGSDFARARSLRAAYRIDGNAVRVEAIRIDGRLLAGAVALPGACR